MGIIFSYFRKKKSTKDILVKLQEDIDRLEEYKESTEQRRKKLVGSLVVYSIAVYLITAICCYFYFVPPKLEQRLLYAIPFVAFPSIIYFIKRILSWYYRWKVGRNEGKLENFKKEKEKILDQVMETETYKVAKDILETFAPERIRKSVMKSPTSLNSPAMQRMPAPYSAGTDLRRRIVSTPVPQNAGPRPRSIVTPGSFIRTPMTQIPQQQQYQMQQSPDFNISSVSNVSQGSMNVPGPPMPRPVLPRERTYLDRFVEYLVGDGPANRYALICSKCESHNGMALKDEFPYIAYRCAYCHFWNPSRKVKPAAPRIQAAQMKQLIIQNTDEEFDDDEDSSSEGCVELSGSEGEDDSVGSITQLEGKKEEMKSENVPSSGLENRHSKIEDSNDLESSDPALADQSIEGQNDETGVATAAKLSFPVAPEGSSPLTVSLDTDEQVLNNEESKENKVDQKSDNDNSGDNKLHQKSED